mgnify:CR=1 FL=1
MYHKHNEGRGDNILKIHFKSQQLTNKGNNMKKYEAVLILNPNLSSKVDEFKTEFNQLLSENSFKVTKLEDIGRRQLAYSINNHNKGHYLLMNLEGDPSKLLEIETKIKYNESIIRHIILVVTSHSEEESVLMVESKNKRSDINETSQRKDTSERTKRGDK